MASCGGSGNKASDSAASISDSTSTEMVDSIKKDSASLAIADKSVSTDSTKTQSSEEKKDEVQSSKNKKEVEKWLKIYKHDAKQFAECIESGMQGSELWFYEESFTKLDKKMKKYQKDMTPEQLKEYKKYKRMVEKARPRY